MFALVALIAALHLTAADNHRVFTVAPHTPIVIVVPWTPGTGYLWEYEPAPGAGKILRGPAGHEIKPKNKPPGAAGKQVWDFWARGKGGATVLRFRYVRPWEKHKPPARRFVVTIRVR